MSDVESLIARTEGEVSAVKRQDAGSSRGGSIQDRVAVRREERRSSARTSSKQETPRAKTGASHKTHDPDASLGSMRALQSSSARWVLEPHEPHADREALEKLADRCLWFSPQVGMETGNEPDGLRLEVSRSARWFGGEEVLVNHLMNWLVQAGYWPRVAIADTLGMAWGWSRFARMACGRLPVADESEESDESQAVRDQASQPEGSRPEEVGEQLLGNEESDREDADREKSGHEEPGHEEPRPANQQQRASQPRTQQQRTEGSQHKETLPHKKFVQRESLLESGSDWEAREAMRLLGERQALRAWKRKPREGNQRQRTTWTGGAALNASQRQAWSEDVQERHWLENVEREIFAKSRGEAQHILSEQDLGSVDERSQEKRVGEKILVGKTIESRNQKTYPLPFIAPTKDSTSFGALPIAALKLDQATCETLRQLGIERVEQLRGLPRDALATRLGSHVLLRLDQVWGDAEETWQTFQSAPDLLCELDLEVPSADRTIIESWLEEVLSRLIERLWERRRGALRLRVTLRGSAEDSRVQRADATLSAAEAAKSLNVVASWGLELFRPTIERKHLMNLIRWQAERKPPRAAVAGLEIEVLLDGPLEAQQQELFDDGSIDHRAAGHLIESLSGRLGRERVLEVVLRGEAQPERAFVTRPAAGSGRSRLGRTRARYLHQNPATSTPKPIARKPTKRKGTRESAEFSESLHANALPRALAQRLDAQPHELTIDDETQGEAGAMEARHWIHRQRRPLRCWSRPIELEVIALAQQGPPAAFRFWGRVWRVAEHWGPERIETGWWRGPWVKRDYYRVETEEGCRFWVFRCLQSNHWFLQGEF